MQAVVTFRSPWKYMDDYRGPQKGRRKAGVDRGSAVKTIVLVWSLAVTKATPGRKGFVSAHSLTGSLRKEEVECKAGP